MPRHNHVLGLVVETARGVRVGRVVNIEIDIDTHTIINYYVKSSWYLRPFRPLLIINKDQVVSITKDRMIVDDLEQKDPLPISRQSVAPSPALE